MSAKAVAEKAFASPYTGLVIAGAVVLVVVYFVLRSTAKAAADVVSSAASGAAGIVTGNNAATAGTEYAGAGVLGTVGAVTNKASGGIFSATGDWIGGALYTLINGDYNPNAPSSATTSKVPGSADAATSQATGATGSW
jgi:hypothetical protein